MPDDSDVIIGLAEAAGAVADRLLALRKMCSFDLELVLKRKNEVIFILRKSGDPALAPARAREAAGGLCA
jgi:hypothetical protein